MRPLQRLALAAAFAVNLNCLAADDELCAQTRKFVQEGDVIFLELDSQVFQRVARASGGWASHVGVAVWDATLNEMVVAHSTIPRVAKWNLCDFLHHAKDDHFSVKRQSVRLQDVGSDHVIVNVDPAWGTFYHTGFKFYSWREFCSKYVWKVYRRTFGIDVGKLETIGDLMKNLEGSPFEKSDREFWNYWYFGRIPLNRVTITPYSQFVDPRFYEVFYHPPKGDPALANRVTQPSEDWGTRPPENEHDSDDAEL